MKPSMESLKGLPQEAVEATIDHWMKMGKLEQLSGVIGLESLMRESKRQHRLRTAEEERVCELLGWKSPGQSENSCLEEDEAMGNIILGNVTNPTPIVVQQPVASPPSPTPIVKRAIGPIAAGLIGAAIPGAGFLGWGISEMLSDDTPSVVDTDSSVELRLKKLPDLDLNQ